MRLFVSVDLPADLADDVGALQDRFRGASGLSFTDPTQAHVTMKFLGDVAADGADAAGDGPDGGVAAVERALERAVAAADVDPFEASLEGLGVFPSLDYISVLWLGVGDGAAELIRLHEAVERRFVDLGFDPEDHEFTPHVTLARMEHAGGKELVQRLVREEHPTVGRMRVDELRLTRSDLGPDGPTYSTVHAVEL